MMNTGASGASHLTGTERGPRAIALHLLRRAEFSAAGAFVASIALVGLFLWSINPNSLVNSLTVVFQGWVTAGLVIAALVPPVATLVGTWWTLRSLRVGAWKRLRRRLIPLVAVGYVSWIVPGHFLFEAFNIVSVGTPADSESPVGLSAP